MSTMKSKVVTPLMLAATLVAAPALHAQGGQAQHHPPGQPTPQEGMMGREGMMGVEGCLMMMGGGMMGGGPMGGMQEGPGMMGQRGMRHGMMGRGMGMGGPMMDHGRHLACLREALNLTDAQVQQLRKLRDTHHQTARSVADQIEDLNVQLEPLTRADRPDVAKIRPLLEKRAALHAQLQAAGLEMHAKAYDVLTPEQREKMKAAREHMPMQRMRMMRERRGEMERP